MPQIQHYSSTGRISWRVPIALARFCNVVVNGLLLPDSKRVIFD